MIANVGTLTAKMRVSATAMKKNASVAMAIQLNIVVTAKRAMLAIATATQSNELSVVGKIHAKIKSAFVDNKRVGRVKNASKVGKRRFVHAVISGADVRQMKFA